MFHRQSLFKAFQGYLLLKKIFLNSQSVMKMSATEREALEEEEREKSEVEKEQKLENDDPEALQHARQWDEYKDGKA